MLDLPRPWNSNGTNRRIRDPAASNVALAASVPVRRRTSNTRQVAAHVPAAAVAPVGTRSRQSEAYEKQDIRNFLQTPRFSAETRQRVRDRINASRHDIEGHSDVAMVDRRFPTRSQANNEDEEDDDIIEVIEPVHARRSRSRTPKASAAKAKGKG